MSKAIYNTSSYTDEFISRVKEYYLDPNNNLSLDKIASKSEQLFGRSFTIETLKFWSSQDGSWSLLKSNANRYTQDVPINEKITKVANKLYDLMMNEEEPIPASQLAQLAKTWSDLIDKAKLNKETTAKTSIQIAKDLIEKQQELLKENDKFK